MKIVTTEVVAMGGRLPRPVGNVRASWRRRDGLLLRLTDEAGRVGQGEASPLPGYSPDSLAECRDALATLPPPELDDGTPIVVQLPSLLETVATPAARFAVETALLDLAGQRAGLPLAVLLGDGASIRRVPLSALLVGAGEAAILDQAERAIARGIGTLKLKVGRDFSAEMRLLFALRGKFGDRVKLRLDANGSFAIADVAARLLTLRAIEPELVEEPVADIAWLGPSPVPIALDESLRRPWPEIARAVESKNVRTFVLKPTVLGGSLACIALARRGRSLGADAIVTHTFEGPVGLAAAAALALALPSAGACGLDHHPGIDAWPAMELPFLVGDSIIASDRPGLGIETVRRQ